MRKLYSDLRPSYAESTDYIYYYNAYYAYKNFKVKIHITTNSGGKQCYLSSFTLDSNSNNSAWHVVHSCNSLDLNRSYDNQEPSEAWFKSLEEYMVSKTIQILDPA